MLQELLGPETPVDESALMEALMDVEPNAERRQTLLQRLSKMSVSERVEFAIKGGSEARRTLIAIRTRWCSAPCCSPEAHRSGSGSVCVHGQSY